MIRRLSTAFAAAATGAALLAPAPPAHADEVDVKPRRTKPGKSVKIYAPADCNDPTATSNAFPYGYTVDLVSEDDRGSPRPVGEAPIDPATTPAEYTVSVRCSDYRELTGAFTVIEGSGGGTGPDTGGGWLSAQAAAHTEKGGETLGGMIAAGAGCVLAGGIGIAFWRARRRKAEPDV